mmetsp:Transcript_15380/g.26624  ORF Transcript_15380/g.26624 Transcript_15380/m.26624 type:complete len:276 (-) Transcript_15380:74-901(-)
MQRLQCKQPPHCMLFLGPFQDKSQPQPQPQSSPRPQPHPQPQTQPRSQAQPLPQSQLQPQPQPRPQSQPRPWPWPQPLSQSMSQPCPQTGRSAKHHRQYSSNTGLATVRRHASNVPWPSGCLTTQKVHRETTHPTAEGWTMPQARLVGQRPASTFLTQAWILGRSLKRTVPSRLTRMSQLWCWHSPCYSACWMLQAHQRSALRHSSRPSCASSGLGRNQQHSTCVPWLPGCWLTQRAPREMAHPTASTARLPQNVPSILRQGRTLKPHACLHGTS